jgi:hypothetical protein
MKHSPNQASNYFTVDASVIQLQVPCTVNILVDTIYSTMIKISPVNSQPDSEKYTEILEHMWVIRTIKSEYFFIF